MYPGDDYVDIVAGDFYSKVPEFTNYEDFRNVKKVIADGEIGPNKASFGNFDEMQVLNVFKGKASYFLQWHSWVNAKVDIKDNLNYKEMMNDPAAITLDKIK
jgi:mannan endo-1,4-beta-mannosidase